MIWLDHVSNMYLKLFGIKDSPRGDKKRKGPEGPFFYAACIFNDDHHDRIDVHYYDDDVRWFALQQDLVHVRKW